MLFILLNYENTSKKGYKKLLEIPMKNNPASGQFVNFPNSMFVNWPLDILLSRILFVKTKAIVEFS